MKEVDIWSAWQCCRGKGSVEELWREEDWFLAKCYSKELA